jgi:hypothetical protein
LANGFANCAKILVKSYEIFAYENDLNRVQYGRMEKGANMTIASLMRVLDVHKMSLEEFFKGLK